MTLEYVVPPPHGAHAAHIVARADRFRVADQFGIHFRISFKGADGDNASQRAVFRFIPGVGFDGIAFGWGRFTGQGDGVPLLNLVSAQYGQNPKVTDLPIFHPRALPLRNALFLFR